MEATSNGAASAMSAQDAREFTEALGQVVSGGWRLSMQAWRLGVPQALGVSHEQWVNEHLGGYVRLSVPDRREVVAEMSADGLSTREIGDVLGVGKSTIAHDRAAVQDRTDEPEETNADGSQDDAAVQDRTEPEPEPDDELPALEDTDLGQQADASIEVRRHRAMRDFMHAVEKTAVLLPQLENIVAGVLEVDAAQARQAAQRTQGTWERVTALLNERSGMRRVK